MTRTETPDPRPVVEQNGERSVVRGARCDGCGARVPFRWPRCPNCTAVLTPADFGPDGTVWSATIVHVSVPTQTAPYALAYVDLDDGPRILAKVQAHGRPPAPPPIDARVRLVGRTPAGDPLVVCTP